MKILNLFGKSVVGIAVLAAFGGANAAAPGRAGAVSGSTTARMPTMPVVSLNTIGNPAVKTIDTPNNVSTGLPNITPTPVKPDPDKPKPDNPDNPPAPSKCPDGGVENSTYTVAMCMNDILQCVNTGALQGGLNDLFNSDVRNSIMNGMRLCQTQIDKCIRDVRVDCRNIYAASSDVWLDFNSRVIQPEYYNFVLRKTGLTPNQAENTCLLLDRNTYGTSFAAVSDTNVVNNEYNQRVGAYNEALNGSLFKNNPQGVEVNTTGYDGNRGHYARWDASKAECLIRVAAYNKDKLIKNSWLFGAVGDDNPAEVWEKAGSTFTCNKDLFDMSSLLNDTKTAAVIAVPGGAVLGTAIGAAAGAGAYNKKHNAYMDNDPCADETYRKDLATKIYQSNKGGILKSYAYKNVSFDEGSQTFTGTPIFGSDTDLSKMQMTEEECRDLHELNEKVGLYQSKVDECLANQTNKKIATAVASHLQGKQVVKKHTELVTSGGSVVIDQGITCPAPQGITQEETAKYDNECKFNPLRSGAAGPNEVYCTHANQCLEVNQIQWQINDLKSVLSAVTPSMKAVKDANKGKEIGKGAAIGAVTGASAGGIATAITALVEKNNITCKVGDGLNTVSLGKSHTIDSLKDFYVKWNLKLPDTVTPTSVVSDRESWQQACSQFNSRLMDCPSVQVNLKKGNNYTLVAGACTISGSMCIANESVVTSHLTSSNSARTQEPNGNPTNKNPAVTTK